MSLFLDFLNSGPHNPENPAEASRRFIVAGDRMKAADLPEGVQLRKSKIAGKRVIVKNCRYYGNYRGSVALWPESRLEENVQHKLVYVLNGELEFQVGTFIVEFGKGHCLMIPSGTPQGDALQIYGRKEKSCDYLNVVLHPHAVQCFIVYAREGISTITRENYLFQNSRLALLLQMLMEVLLEDKKYSSQIAEELLAAFWKMLRYETEQERYINPGPTGRFKNSEVTDNGFEADLQYYLRTHLDQPLTLGRVAQALHLSRTQFVRQMRRETGKTFVQYLTDYRMNEAKALLRDSNWTISAIAGFLGYKSPAYFQSVFHRATGQNPSEYRAALRKRG